MGLRWIRCKHGISMHLKRKSSPLIPTNKCTSSKVTIKWVSFLTFVSTYKRFTIRYSKEGRMRYWSGEEKMTIYRVILPTTLKWFGMPTWNSDTFTNILKISIIGHGKSYSALSRTQPCERWKMFSDSWYWYIFNFQQCDSWDNYHHHGKPSSLVILGTQQYERCPMILDMDVGFNSHQYRS